MVILNVSIRSAHGQLRRISVSGTKMKISTARHGAEPCSLLCVRRLTYYRLNVWTEGLTRPGISVWTCSASTTLSVGSGDRSAVCKSYQKTLWCLHPVDEDRKSADKGTQSMRVIVLRQQLFLPVEVKEKNSSLQLFISLKVLNPAKFPRFFFFLHSSTCSSTIFHLNRNVNGLLLFLKPWATPEQNTI